jgi:hypothetical protein
MPQVHPSPAMFQPINAKFVVRCDVLLEKVVDLAMVASILYRIAAWLPSYGRRSKIVFPAR